MCIYQAPQRTHTPFPTPKEKRCHRSLDISSHIDFCLPCNGNKLRKLKYHLAADSRRLVCSQLPSRSGYCHHNLFLLMYAAGSNTKGAQGAGLCRKHTLNLQLWVRTGMENRRSMSGKQMLACMSASKSE